MTAKKGSKKSKEKEVESNLNIIAATIKEGFCHYDYEVKEGEQIGDKVKVKGHGLVEQDMNDAFHKLKIHLAIIDEVFRHKDITIGSINSKMHNHEIIADYFVHGFKIRGSEGDEHVILVGQKKITSGGMMDLVTPPIPIDTFSSYEWHKDLKNAIEDCREEVLLYKNGKYTEMEIQNDDTQLTLVEEGGDDGLEGGRM